jgi:hypothetical protein
MSRLTRCRFCQAPVEFLRSPFTGEKRKFEASPIDGHHDMAVKAFPVMSGRAYKFADLAAIVQVQRECALDAAEDEVRDMPWYVPHDCPNSPFRTHDDESGRP